MKRFNFLLLAYNAALVAMPISAIFNTDLQALYRIPLFNIRYIDIAILLIVINIFSFLKFDILNNLKKSTKILFIFCAFFLLFQAYNFFRTFGTIEFIAQIGFLIANLCVLITLNVILTLSKEQILAIVKKLLYVSTFIIAIFFVSLFYSLYTGSAEFTQDVEGKRIMFTTIGSKETVGIANILCLTFFFAVFSKYLKSTSTIQKMINLLLIIVVILSTFLSFHRGTVFSVTFIIFVYFLYSAKNLPGLMTKVVIIFFVVIAVGFLTSGLFLYLGVNPIDNLISTISFALDTDNPNWDKGRDFARILGIQVWQENYWTGIGYVYMDMYTRIYNVSYPHSFFITSLMHNGVIGTFFYTIIYVVIYFKTYRLAKFLFKKELPNNEKIIYLGLVVTSLLWLVPLLTQEVQFERYSSSIQFFIYGAIIKIVDDYE